MILPLFRRSRRDETIAGLYGAIVAQARSPAFYSRYGVPDTVEGRLEMIVLHVVLLLRRLAGEAAEVRARGQRVFDLFCRDMDDNLREMGVGDLAVPRQMRRIGAAFYGRSAAYEAALASDDPQLLAQALTRNILPDGAANAGNGARLAAYVRESERHLAAIDACDTERLVRGFPDPDAVVVSGNLSDGAIA
jgi:cytochrome b pre-mRNA-processing protein 3